MNPIRFLPIGIALVGAAAPVFGWSAIPVFFSYSPAAAAMTGLCYGLLLIGSLLIAFVVMQ